MQAIGFEIDCSGGKHFYMDSIKNDHRAHFFAHMKTVKTLSFLPLLGLLPDVLSWKKETKSISILLDLMLYPEQISVEQ